MANLLTTNQANGGEDGTTIGFGLYESGVYNMTPPSSAVIFNSTTNAWEETHSILIETLTLDLSPKWFGIIPFTVDPTVSAYTFSLYWLNAAITHLYANAICIIDNNNVIHNTVSLSHTSDNVWARATVSTNPLYLPSATALQGILVCTQVLPNGGQVYVDGLQLETGTSATTWALPAPPPPPPSLATPFGIFINDSIVKTKVNV